MKQTAVEWLYNNLKSLFEHDGDLLEVVQMSFEQAKEMEKEQIIGFAFDFYYDFSNKLGVPFNLISENRLNTEQYYNETYKSEQ